MSSQSLHLFRRFGSSAPGRWLVSRAICWRAPYFASIAPTIEALEPGRCVVCIRDRRRVRNHIGTVHAIALCNLAEFVGGLTCDVSLPKGMRWIPRGMQVEYLKKAVGTMTATATPAFTPHVSEDGYELPLDVSITDDVGAEVFRARIAMWITPAAPPKPAA